MIPKIINNQENRFELANPGLFVVLRNIPKIKINTDKANPNITLFISQFLQLRNHLVMTHSFIFEVSHKMLFFFFSRSKLIQDIEKMHLHMTFLDSRCYQRTKRSEILSQSRNCQNTHQFLSRWFP